MSRKNKGQSAPKADTTAPIADATTADANTAPVAAEAAPVVDPFADVPVTSLGDDVSFELTRNTGSAFSLFQAFTPLLALVAVGVAVLLVREVRRSRDTLMIVGLSLVLGGALGNLTDRVFRSPGFLEGAVVDFVHVGRFPTFNIADSAITVGAALIVIWAIRADIADRKATRG